MAHVCLAPKPHAECGQHLCRRGPDGVALHAAATAATTGHVVLMLLAAREGVVDLAKPIPKLTYIPVH